MNKVYTNVDPACITDCGYQIVVSSPFVQIIIIVIMIHRKCELGSLKKMLNSLCWDDDYTIAQWLEHR